jgi:hypothetical protein
LLKPHIRCNDKFWFVKDDDNRVKIDSQQLEDPQDNYCLGFHYNGTITVEVCTKKMENNKFR